MKCPNKEKCGKEIPDDSLFCPHCGIEIPHKKNPWPIIIITALLVIGVVIAIYWGTGINKSSKEQLDDTQISITAISSNETMGLVKGSGNYIKSDTITITAIPNCGFSFISWDDGSKERIRKVIVDTDRKFVAYFEAKLVSRFEITVNSSHPQWGTVSGGGTYDSLTVVSIKAKANDGYKFDSWDDGSTKNPRKIIVGGNHNYEAQFSVLPLKEEYAGGTYNLGWGIYKGSMNSDGLPHGTHGIVNVTQVHDIDLKDVTGEKITVYPGDIIETNFVNGLLRSGEVKSRDGNSQLFSIF